ncbi:threonine--tRNA ligase [Bittarella massiliensis (ex Durand et al. 2017)]|uniref:Threonine--tRNA ligase n=1 Tax=Bittarella massiliensis (ex Durand et al. 2017) TaxID=1720313 RepID=A0AAW5K8A7_9FIRM|nr:threonine--tRNA ligase [Bittarella massiliensis (ex Durand et al. 2017)]MBC2871893.1 threonine--tRNA ligase [Bittarella massiliensis (ex Durand et al. 2017)]MCQ4948127.1 threonine--tRNA ligase [Bittarella massiliensis (ex Durand et al. 2017)]
MIDVKLKDGSSLQVEQGSTVAEVAKQISMGLYRNAVGGLVDGEVADLRQPLEKDCSLEILTFEDAAGKRVFWHTASHVLAQAVQHLFPGVKFAIGPAIDGGFYYDFDVEKPFTTEDLEKIEAEMKKIAKEALPLERFELDPAEAKELMADQPYKLELIEEHAGKGEKISFFKQGDFTDLCAGPHLLDTSKVKAVKLTSATGAYWRGDSDKAMLCRVYGTAFPKASLLEEHLALLEEAKKRDHRKLGKELELFTLLDEGPGFPFFLPKGMVLKNTLIDYWREIHHKAGYQEISTPIILSRTLWERSGHWGHYKDNMYTTVIDEQDFAIKPMNCPGGMLVYKTQPHSYRDLPMRVGELGLVHRHELSGALHGLMRVRCFTQDDAHIFMTSEQIKDEIKGVIRLIDEVYSLFGFPYKIELSTMPEDHMGSDEDWERATNGLKEAMEELGREYTVNEGDGAFYGPKLDFHLVDAIGRTWQCGTIQLDMQMPERFELEYTGEDGQKHRPVMIHRVVFGSIERFIGILIEHFAGAFPTWLAPVQVKIVPISEKFHDYAQQLQQQLDSQGIRVEGDYRAEKMGYKIREAQLQKIPYMLVVGEKEQSEGNVSVRSRSEGDLGAMSVEAFTDMVRAKIATKERD